MAQFIEVRIGNLTHVVNLAHIENFHAGMEEDRTIVTVNKDFTFTVSVSYEHFKREVEEACRYPRGVYTMRKEQIPV